MSIANLGHDERWRYTGGNAGDQTGTEWQVIPWFNYPWDVMLRYPDAEVRHWMGDQARAAANNNNIGYDQGQRTTFWSELVKNGYDASKITAKCEADCSSGVLSIVKAAGYHFNIDKLKNVNYNGWTGNEKQILVSAGFTVYYASKYLTSDAYLDNGDILLNEKNHTTFNINRGAYCDASSSSGTSSETKPKETSVKVPSITYGVKTKSGILKDVKNGVAIGDGKRIIGLKVGVDVGRVEYRVHCGGRWLPKVSGCDWSDFDNGYAGDDVSPIDAVQIYYYSDTSKTALYEAVYAVKVEGLNYLANVFDTDWESTDGDNTAGLFGRPVTEIKIKLMEC